MMAQSGRDLTQIQEERCMGFLGGKHFSVYSRWADVLW